MTDRWTVLLDPAGAPVAIARDGRVILHLVASACTE